MDLLQVRKKDYSIGQLVEDHSTLIWTERFQDPGEFELHTSAITRTRQLLPELSLCTLRDSNEVMIVESHEIDTDDAGIQELVVKGRTLDSFLENRIWTNAPYGKTLKMAKNYSVRQAVEVWVWNAICNGTGNDRIDTSDDYPAANQLPNVVVTCSVSADGDGPNKPRKVQNGVVYDQMRTFLSSGKLGIRIIRPNGTKGHLVHIDGDGTYNKDGVTTFDTDLRFDIYQGRDISDKVVFSWKAGALDSPQYLFSSALFKTGAFVDGDPRHHYYTDPDAIPGTNSGWNRRDTYVDGGSKDDGTTADDFEDSLEDQGLRAVRKDGRHVNMVDASINPFNGYKYGKDYHLGDQVMVQGQYGAHDKKWVTEFIRTQDANGEYGYPTLSSTLS